VKWKRGPVDKELNFDYASNRAETSRGDCVTSLFCITFTRFQLLKNADFVLKKIIVICLKFNREIVMTNVKKNVNNLLYIFALFMQNKKISVLY